MTWETYIARALIILYSSSAVMTMIAGVIFTANLRIILTVILLDLILCASVLIIGKFIICSCNVVSSIYSYEFFKALLWLFPQSLMISLGVLGVIILYRSRSRAS